MLTAGRLWRMSSSLAAVNLSFSFRTPSPHDSLALKKNRDTWRLQAQSTSGCARLSAGLEALSTEFHVRQ